MMIAIIVIAALLLALLIGSVPVYHKTFYSPTRNRGIKRCRDLL